MPGKKRPAKGPGKPGPSVADSASVADILSDFYAEQIERQRERIQKGDGDALLSALWDVCLSGSPMPDWLSVAVASAIRRYSHMHVKTLDEAFQVKKRVAFAKRSKRVRYGMRMYFEVCALHSVGVSITPELFKAITELYPDVKDRKIVAECYATEFKRRGNRRVSNTGGDPERLPGYLKPVFESMTGKRLKKGYAY